LVIYLRNTKNMKWFLLLIVSISAVFASPDWDSFKEKHHKIYKNEKEENYRKQIFLKNLKVIEEHNEKYAQGLSTYSVGVNNLADLTHEEIVFWSQGSSRRNLSVGSSPIPKFIPRDDVPESIDWRDYGVVTPIANQERCMSCWAFAIVATVESHVAIYEGRNVSLSVQNLVDCVDPTFDCMQDLDPKALDNTYQYIIDNDGIDLIESYPNEYQTVGSCRFKRENVGATIKAYANITEGDEEELKAVVGTVGPVTVTFTTDFAWDFYHKGVYYNDDCMNTDEIFNHAAVVVGYGNEDGEDYWLVKNSWGTYFGQDGYIKMARNRDNNCGIASRARYPLM
jgi:cathepsin L